VIIFADNGPGIPPEERERLFAPFRRLAMHRDRPGSGLGLYFTKNLVTQLGGRIWVESEPGAGSRFHVQLPEARSAPPQDL
jgi:signal transduction histidine kinase